MKMVTIVNQDIDVADPVRVEWAMMTRWQPDRDKDIQTGKLIGLNVVKLAN